MKLRLSCYSYWWVHLEIMMLGWELAVGLFTYLWATSFSIRYELWNHSCYSYCHVDEALALSRRHEAYWSVVVKVVHTSMLVKCCTDGLLNNARLVKSTRPYLYLHDNKYSSQTLYFVILNWAFFSKTCRYCSIIYQRKLPLLIGPWLKWTNPLIINWHFMIFSTLLLHIVMIKLLSSLYRGTILKPFSYCTHGLWSFWHITQILYCRISTTTWFVLLQLLHIQSLCQRL